MSVDGSGDWQGDTPVEVTGSGLHTLEFWSVDGPYRAEGPKFVEFTIE